MSDEKMIEIMSLAWWGLPGQTPERFAAALSALRAAGYLLIPTEGPEWDAALERMFAALPSDAQGLIGSGEMERILRAAGRVE